VGSTGASRGAKEASGGEVNKSYAKHLKPIIKRILTETWDKDEFASTEAVIDKLDKIYTFHNSQVYFKFHLTDKTRKDIERLINYIKSNSKERNNE
jgi:hypothetical protein